MSTTACDACGECLHTAFAHTNEKGTFCNEDCAHDALNGVKQPDLPYFDGWDDGINHGADLFSKKHNSIFKSWENTAFRERNL